MGLETALILGAVAAAGIGGGVALSKASSGKSESAPSPQPLPQPPAISDVQDKAQDIARKRKAQQSKTVYTSPLGVQDEANIARKTLLGQ